MKENDSKLELIKQSVEPEQMKALAQPRCMLCGTQGKRIYEAMPDRLFSAPGKWNLSQCQNSECGLVWLDPMPIEEDIGIAYRNYYTHGEANQPAKRTILSKALFSLLGLERERSRIENCYLENEQAGRILELGFGDGKCLERLALLGWAVEGQEVDPVSAASARQRGFTVHEGKLQELLLPDSEYDVIVSNHMIEHVHDPIMVLSECYRLLRPGGRIVMSTPNFDSYGHDMFGRKWLHLDPPRHLHIFSPENMMRVVKDAGFSDVRVWTTHVRSLFNYLASIELPSSGPHKVEGPMKLSSKLRVAQYLARARVKQIFKPLSGDEMVVVATREK